MTDNKGADHEGVGDALHGAVGGLEAVGERLESDVEEVLGHPCRATVESVNPETNVVQIRVELDLAKLRERLEEAGEFEDIDVGISDDFVFEISPSPEAPDASHRPADVSTSGCE